MVFPSDVVELLTLSYTDTSYPCGSHTHVLGKTADMRDAMEAVRGEKGAYPGLVKTALLDGQALPEEEDVVLLGQDLQGLGCRQRN